MNNYIAFDVSKQELDAYDGKESLTFKNEKGLKVLKRYLKRHFKRFDNLTFIFEPTGPYSNYIKHFCTENSIKACIINPKKSSNFSKVLGERSKTDEIDSKTLYAFSALIKDGEDKVPESDEAVDLLSNYLSTYEWILKTRVSLSNHIHALTYQNNPPHSLMGNLKKELKRFTKMEEDMLKDTVKAIESNKELREDYENLLTIPGIGEVSAIALLYMFRRYKDTNRSEIVALLGLDPTKKESGTSVRRKSRISKNGNAMIRTILYFPTMNATRYNDRIKTFYERLIDNNKPKKVAIIASMKKLLLIAHAIYKTKTPYKNSEVEAYA